MYVNIDFLNGDLKENVFMSQPEGFVVKGQEHKVCKLIKSLYCLKQAPRAWYGKLTEHLLKLNISSISILMMQLCFSRKLEKKLYILSYM
jgi:hypothetical protein